MIESMIIGGITGGLTVIIGTLLLAKNRACPKCATKVPKVRIPKSIREMLRGGWTCTGCGEALDKLGNAKTGVHDPQP